MYKLFILAAFLAFAAAVPAPAPAPAPAPKPAPGAIVAQPLLYNTYSPYSAYVGIGPLPYSYQPLITSYSGVAPIYKPATYVL